MLDNVLTTDQKGNMVDAELDCRSRDCQLRARLHLAPQGP